MRQQEAVDKIRADMDRFVKKEAKSEHAYEVITR